MCPDWAPSSAPRRRFHERDGSPLTRGGNTRDPDPPQQVKGGEDLRLDERVEQLFEAMNAVMSRSPACRRARLALKTFKVL